MPEEIKVVSETIVEKNIPEERITIPARVDRGSWRWNMGSDFPALQPGQTVKLTLTVDDKEYVTMTYIVEKEIEPNMELRCQIAFLPLIMAPIVNIKEVI